MSLSAADFQNTRQSSFRREYCVGNVAHRRRLGKGRRADLGEAFVVGTEAAEVSAGILCLVPCLQLAHCGGIGIVD